MKMWIGSWYWYVVAAVRAELLTATADSARDSHSAGMSAGSVAPLEPRDLVSHRLRSPFAMHLP